MGSLPHPGPPEDQYQDEDDEVDVGGDDDEAGDGHRGDGDKREEKNEVGEAKRCKQVMEHGGHRPEKYFLSDTTSFQNTIIPYYLKECLYW